jgi:hypothetical protein
MGGFTDPTQIEIDPLAQSLRPLRDTSAGLLLQQLLGGQRPLQEMFSGLANPVEQLFPGATLNPPQGTQRVEDPREFERRNAGGFSCPEGFELNFLPDGTPVCTPSSPGSVENPRTPREPIPGFQPPPPPSEGGPPITTDPNIRNRPRLASASAFESALQPIPTQPTGNTSLQSALANPSTLQQSGPDIQMQTNLDSLVSLLMNLASTSTGDGGVTSGSRVAGSATPSFQNQTTSPTFGNELFKL